MASRTSVQSYARRARNAETAEAKLDLIARAIEDLAALVEDEARRLSNKMR